jgi:hypothetical protein
MVPSILEPLVRGPPQEAAKLNTFMREPLFSLRLKIGMRIISAIQYPMMLSSQITLEVCSAFFMQVDPIFVLINNVHCVSVPFLRYLGGSQLYD